MFRLITVVMLQLLSSIYKFLTKYVFLLLPPRDRQKSDCYNGTKAWNILQAGQWRNYTKMGRRIELWPCYCWWLRERQKWKLTACQICKWGPKSKN